MNNLEFLKNLLKSLIKFKNLRLFRITLRIELFRIIQIKL